jgi:hypothetical protein
VVGPLSSSASARKLIVPAALGVPAWFGVGYLVSRVRFFNPPGGLL